MNKPSKAASHRPAKYFGHFLGPMDQLESQYNKLIWAEVAAIVYAPTFHTVLEIWCARIHAPDYLEEDTFVIDESADLALRRARHFVTGLDLGLIEISPEIEAINKLVV